MMTADEALAWLLERAKAVDAMEEVAVEDALGRVLAEDVAATVSAPPLDNSAMDGYAVRLADLDPEGETALPVAQRIPAGHVGQPLAQGTAARIFTGAPVPPGADTVVMQEHCTEADGRVTVRRAPQAGANVRRAGEDFAAGATVLVAGTRLGPQHQGLAAAAGHARLKVVRRLKVAAFFTGDEIVMPGEPLKPGQIYNSNRFALRGLLQGLGCEVVDLGIVPDRFDATVDVLRQAARQADAVITSGGVSVGEEDHVKAAVESIGKLTMWKVAMKPGKPLAFGELDGAFFLGLPGNPVSAFVTFCLFARPFLLRCQGVRQVAPPSYILPAAFEWKKPGDRREFARARLDIGADGAPVATLYPNQSSGALSSVAWAQGLVELPEGKTIERGQSVKFIPFSELLS
jgi:molybdopterin molybdotransferase